jgi:actin related protein 2/3 complex subunit 2
MILLENHNRILQEAIQSRLDNGPSEVEITCADFDGVQFHVSNPDRNNKNVVNVSINWKILPELLKNGGQEELKKIYGPLLQATPEQGYGVTLQIDLSNPPNKDTLAERVSLLKRHLLAAPFKKAFAGAESGNPGKEVVPLFYREGEAIFIKPEGDRVIVVFMIQFKDPGDQVLAKNFLQAFVARPNFAPAVSFTQKEPPAEVAGLPGVKDAENYSFVSFVLFKNHMKNADRTINSVITFRNYLHYHIKCSKAYMHTRMRNRVEALLQVLNRARPVDPEKKGEKKTAAGKTFVRK